MYWQSSCPTVQSANSYLLDTGTLSDVDFLVGETKERIPAHKFILMSRSPVFQAKFERWDTRLNCEVIIPGMVGNTFRRFLKFLYTNEFDVTDGNDGIKILKLAHKYDIPELMAKCSKFLENCMNSRNVIHFHQVAKRYEGKILQERTMEFIARNTREIFKEDEFLEIDEDTFRSVLENDDLQIDELGIFRAAMRWADNECSAQDLEHTIENKRLLSSGLIPFIRFTLIHPHDFSEEVVRKNKGILTEEEIIAIYLQLNSLDSNKQYLPRCPFNIKARAESKPSTIDANIQRPVIRARRRDRDSEI